MTKALAPILILLVALASCGGPAYAKCPFDICAGEKRKTLDSDKNVKGDIYNPGHGRRLQIRNKDRVILGYIERSGRITDRDRVTKGYLK